MQAFVVLNRARLLLGQKIAERDLRHWKPLAIIVPLLAW